MNAELYNEDLQYIAGLPLPWEKMRGSSLLITGATGMIGRFLADALMFKNRTEDFGCHIYVTGRSMAKLKDRFKNWLHILCAANGSVPSPAQMRA